MCFPGNAYFDITKYKIEDSDVSGRENRLAGCQTSLESACCFVRFPTQYKSPSSLSKTQVHLEGYHKGTGSPRRAHMVAVEKSY